MTPDELRTAGVELRRLGDALEGDAARLALVTATSLGEDAWHGGSAAEVRSALAGGAGSVTARLRGAAHALRRSADELDGRAAALETAAARAAQADAARTRPRPVTEPTPPGPVPELVQ